MMRSFWGLSWLAVCSSLGCGAKEGATAPNLADCTTCAIKNPGGTLHPSSEGGTGTEPDAGNAPTDGASTQTGDAGEVTVTLTLALLADPPFASPTPTTSSRVIVSAYDRSGGVVDTGSAGVILPETLDGVATGPNWFAVQDATPAPTIAPTLQPVNVGTNNPSVALSALNIGQLAASNIDMELLGSPAAGEATVVLVFRQGGKAVSGVTVKGNPGASRVAYYTGSSASPYQTEDRGITATGAESTVMVTHVPAAGQFPQTVDLTLTCNVGNQSTFDVHVKVAQKFATWMVVEVP
jgi:hypothetical protein